MPKTPRPKETPNRQESTLESAQKRRAAAAHRRSTEKTIRNLREELDSMEKLLKEEQDALGKEKEEKKLLEETVGRKDAEIEQLKARQAVNSSLECPVCFEAFTEQLVPRIIRCGHTICTECLSTLQRSGELINCPVCRATNIRNPRHPYPPNYALLALLPSSPPN